MLLAGGLTAVVALIVMLAPRSAPAPAAADVRRRVAGLAALPGNDTFAPFTLRHDKAYAFSADGRAALGYRVLFGVAVVGGDPVGDGDARQGAVRVFLELCARQGWRPLAIGVRGDLATLWTAFGLRSIGIGDEVVVDTEHFTLDTPRLRNVRQAVKRTHNMGVTTVILRERELDGTMRQELAEVTARCWGGMPERGFSMNLDGLLAGIHPEALLVVCRDRSGVVVAFQRHVLCAGGRALSLDTMCRLPDAPNGVNERMIVEAMQWGSARGVRQASLNFAAFRPLFDAEQRRPVEALGYRTVHLLDRWIKLESLYQFNAKFRPSWVPRSVVLRSWSDLPFVLPAALTAEFGGSLDFRRPSTAALRAQADADAAGVRPPLPADGLANPPLANP
jgi:lysyl-tRNA synthetase class 2